MGNVGTLVGVFLLVRFGGVESNTGAAVLLFGLSLGVAFSCRARTSSAPSSATWSFWCSPSWWCGSPEFAASRARPRCCWSQV
ncbi:hypothetical protein [Cryptosporangium arvum]|uniref:hypothetical protein n=1 Tax=Cryptosporangium arvum TaxID=80871 RepID=UPI0004ACE2B4|nr:hypothetical protein [Cryptosporangium arvum]